MRLFVTGATGFLGTWLVQHLVERNHDVSVLVRASQLPPELRLPRVRLCQGDILNKNALETHLQGQEGVFHLAGYIGYKRSERQMMTDVNVTGTANVIAACIKNKVPRLLHVSTVNAIGASFDKSVLNEESPYNLTKYHLGYSETKRAAEDLVRENLDQLDSVIVNPSTVYGPGDMKKSSRSMQAKIAKGEFPFYTNGGVSIADVYEVVKAMLTAFESGRKGERYILAGKNLTIKEVFTMIAQEAGAKPPHIHLPNILVSTLGGLGDVLERFNLKGPVNSESAILSLMYHWFDSSKAQKELNYKIVEPKLSIHNSIQWMKDQGLLSARS